jgi:selenocysteine-specific elongation factor
VVVSSTDGRGLDELREVMVRLRDGVLARQARVSGASPGTSRLAIDRSFTIKGRGAVVTGTLRGGPLVRGTSLRLVPGDRMARARELQVHGARVESAERGRVAINLGGVEASELHRGQVLTDDPAVGSSDRLLVGLARRLPERTRARMHLGTASVDVAVSRSGRDAIDLADGSVAAILRLVVPVAVAPGDRFLLRRPSGDDRVVGGTMLDIAPPRGIARRRQTAERVSALAEAIDGTDSLAAAAARLDLHGAVVASGGVQLAVDVAERLDADVLSTFVAAPVQGLPGVRAGAARSLRHRVTLGAGAASRSAAEAVDRLVEGGRLVRDGGSLGLPGSRPSGEVHPAMAVAMDRLERALGVPTPPPLAAAARAAGCPPGGVRELERLGRIVLLEPDLAYARAIYRELTGRALALAGAAPLTPAALRDATGTSRRYVMAILEDLDRRGILRRTDVGHILGPRSGTVDEIGR